LKDLVIYTQLRKSIGAYDATSPELAAAQKAIKRGKPPDEVEGVTIGYIVTKHGSTISEKAELEEYATDYDADYYINHQVIPATLKILKELGVSEEELKGNGMQKRLS
ncbi:MAG: DNA polymerase, partial [Candidatus Micrarchaeia archaeon]